MFTDLNYYNSKNLLSSHPNPNSSTSKRTPCFATFWANAWSGLCSKVNRFSRTHSWVKKTSRRINGSAAWPLCSWADGFMAKMVRNSGAFLICQTWNSTWGCLNCGNEWKWRYDSLIDWSPSILLARLNCRVCLSPGYELHQTLYEASGQRWRA